MYLSGITIMLYNFFMTLKASKAAKADLSDTQASSTRFYDADSDSDKSHGWHHVLEGRAFQFSIFTLVAVIIGGLAEIIPLVTAPQTDPLLAKIHPLTALEQEGRDIYLREGCYNCHSQMIRPFKDEELRYGMPTKTVETVYDHPFQFGSKRTGPDLQRQGGKYPSFWHYRHMKDPRLTSSGSIMPKYSWLYTDNLDTSLTSRKLSALKTLGVPYTDGDVSGAVDSLNAQAQKIAGELRSQGAELTEEDAGKEIIALIAYLQRLGTDIKK
jgi:cytochrome c oxidase cbb3-type subunit I/II